MFYKFSFIVSNYFESNCLVKYHCIVVHLSCPSIQSCIIHQHPPSIHSSVHLVIITCTWMHTVCNIAYIHIYIILLRVFSFLGGGLFSSLFSVSATAFKNAKAFEQAKECYIKAAETQKSMNSYPWFSCFHISITFLHISYFIYILFECMCGVGIFFDVCVFLFF